MLWQAFSGDRAFKEESGVSQAGHKVHHEQAHVRRGIRGHARGESFFFFLPFCVFSEGRGGAVTHALLFVVCIFFHQAKLYIHTPLK